MWFSWLQFLLWDITKALHGRTPDSFRFISYHSLSCQMHISSEDDLAHTVTKSQISHVIHVTVSFTGDLPVSWTLRLLQSEHHIAGNESSVLTSIAPGFVLLEGRDFTLSISITLFPIAMLNTHQH